MKRCLVAFLSVFVLQLVFSNSNDIDRYNPADIVVMMDTSGTILPYYDDINQRVLNEINSKFLRIGDTFHLISFNATPKYEISQKIGSETDVSRIVSRFMLLYQLGQNSDFLLAMDYAKKYTLNLHTPNMDKILIIISDGIFNPAPESPYKNYNNEQIKNKISGIASDIRSNNWKVYYVKLPFPDNVIIKDLDDNIISDGSTLKDRNMTKVNRKDNVTHDYTDQEKENDYSKSIPNKDYQNIASRTSDEIVNKKNISITDNSILNDNQNSVKEDNYNKEYSDISGDVNRSLGTVSSDLPKDKNTQLVINDDANTLPTVDFPSMLTCTGSKLSLPLTIRNNSKETVDLILSFVSLEKDNKTYNVDIANTSIHLLENMDSSFNINIKLPKDFKVGKQNLTIRLIFEENKTTMPQIANIPLEIYPTFVQKVFYSDNAWLYITLLVILLIVLLLILLLLISKKTKKPMAKAIRNIHGGYPNEATNSINRDSEDHSDVLSAYGRDSSDALKYEKQSNSDYVSKLADERNAEARARMSLLNSSVAANQSKTGRFSPASHTEKIEIKRNQSGMTEIYVFNQTRSIGKRNIHVMKPGTRLSVGGTQADDFLIFLVKFPHKLAEVRYDGKDYHLAILKPEYFPYETSNKIHNCIGKTITVVSDRGYHVGFTFREYEDPITKLNNILTSINYT